MFEGSMKSFGWGYVGSDEKGFEWLFTPDVGDPSYLENPATGKPYSCCCCRSGDVFKSEAAAVRDGRRWMKKAGYSGTIEAVKATSRHFEY